MEVICLCALWCDTCAEYRDGFFALAREFPELRFRWLDVEDDAAEVDDLEVAEVENFPTLLVRRNGAQLFYGPMQPRHEHLRRLLQDLQEKS